MRIRSGCWGGDWMRSRMDGRSEGVKSQQLDLFCPLIHRPAFKFVYCERRKTMRTKYYINRIFLPKLIVYFELCMAFWKEVLFSLSVEDSLKVWGQNELKVSSSFFLELPSNKDALLIRPSALLHWGTHLALKQPALLIIVLTFCQLSNAQK